MKKKIIKKLIKNKKGSALILTMIVLVNAILIVTAIGTVSIMEQKSSSRTKNSTPAFQKADSGLEYILKEINDGNGSARVDSYCSPFINGKCTVGSVDGVTIYFLIGAEGNRSVIITGDTVTSNVTAVRSVGEYGTGQERVTRSLEADMEE